MNTSETPHSSPRNSPPQQDSPEHAANPIPPALSEKQRRELWLYLAVSICTVEILVTVGAVIYGFMASASTSSGRLAFPWITWGAVMIASPCLMLLAVHLAGVGLFRPPSENDEEWQKHLPERMQRLYRIVKGAPTVALLLGVVVLGVALITVDEVLGTLSRIAGTLTPHIPVIIGALAAILCCIVGASVWLNYRTRKLYAEYDFRREVLQKTGVIIVDKDSTPLPPGGAGPMPNAIVAAETLETLFRPALPQAPEAAPPGMESSAPGGNPPAADASLRAHTGNRDGIIIETSSVSTQGNTPPSFPHSSGNDTAPGNTL